jgi:hypothetical protein
VRRRLTRKARPRIRRVHVWGRITEGSFGSRPSVRRIEEGGVIMVGSVLCQLSQGAIGCIY